MQQYLFTSERLGFRSWEKEDIPKMIRISADPRVMEFFPAAATPVQTEDFIQKMQQMFSEMGYCYFAVDRLKDRAFIGFIGLCDQTYEAAFTPCVDIGWRLDQAFWGNGYATEGAKQCISYAFDHLHLNNIKSTTSKINVKSISVMEKIGMKKLLEFKHPKLIHDTRLVDCVCYEIEK